MALRAMREGVAFDDDTALLKVLEGLDLHFHVQGETNHVFMGSEDVSTQIRTPEISMGASAVSSRGVVRERLLGLQRRLALQAKHGAILEGRDIGTVVFPDAEVKIFLDASPEVRARRRFEELFAKGVETPIEAVLADQTKRDRDDAASYRLCGN